MAFLRLKGKKVYQIPCRACHKCACQEAVLCTEHPEGVKVTLRGAKRHLQNNFWIKNELILRAGQNFLTLCSFWSLAIRMQFCHKRSHSCGFLPRKPYVLRTPWLLSYAVCALRGGKVYLSTAWIPTSFCHWPQAQWTLKCLSSSDSSRGCQI